MNIFVVAVLLLGAGVYWFFSGNREAQMVIGDRVTYNIEVVSDPISQAKGLSGRKLLSEDAGMLFVFNGAAPRSFWMNQMNFSIDVVWIENFKVIGVSENISHPTPKQGAVATMKSPAPADMVLEINAGQVAAQGIRIGDIISL